MSLFEKEAVQNRQNPLHYKELIAQCESDEKFREFCETDEGKRLLFFKEASECFIAMIQQCLVRDLFQHSAKERSESIFGVTYAELEWDGIAISGYHAKDGFRRVGRYEARGEQSVSIEEAIKSFKEVTRFTNTVLTSRRFFGLEKVPITSPLYREWIAYALIACVRSERAKLRTVTQGAVGEDLTVSMAKYLGWKEDDAIGPGKLVELIGVNRLSATVTHRVVWEYEVVADFARWRRYWKRGDSKKSNVFNNVWK